MPITDPQPGDILRRTEVALLLGALRANLALAEHVLGRHMDPKGLALVDELREVVAHVQAHAAAEPGASKG